MSGTKWRQNVDPLVSFWWHLYYLFVTLDREPKETAREEEGLASASVRLCVCVCVWDEEGKDKKEGKTVGGTRDDIEKSKG